MRIPLFLLLLAFAISCQSTSQPPEEQASDNSNPPAEGFNLNDSDEKAIAIADAVMDAMGGRKNWDDTRYIHWNFFGRRTLLWDKHTGRVRIEIPEEEAVYLVNVHDGEGQVRIGDKEYTDADSLAKYLDRAKSIWINDSYWLVMPFKLKDSGVTLKYLGQDTTLAGKTSDVLSLTFSDVGKTPDNKYHVYVDPETNLVSQWDFFSKATDEKPRFALPWQDYKEHRAILLSGDRGQRKLSDIAVYSKAPDAAFESLDAINRAEFSE